MPERWLSEDEIVAHLGDNLVTIYKWIARKPVSLPMLGRHSTFRSTKAVDLN